MQEAGISIRTTVGEAMITYGHLLLRDDYGTVLAPHAHGCDVCCSNCLECILWDATSADIGAARDTDALKWRAHLRRECHTDLV
jgi:hypothetical protein